MAVGHLIIRRYKINIRPENFRPIIFQWFGKAADLIVGQMLCPRRKWGYMTYVIKCYNISFITLLMLNLIDSQRYGIIINLDFLIIL